jgi:hypothetical protein
MRERETIERAAIRIGGEVWDLPRPARHAVLVKAWRDAHSYSKMPDHEHGFVTSTGRFVPRDLAAKIAFLAGQVDRRRPLLSTEHLW